jgi:hypothetical protein
LKDDNFSLNDEEFTHNLFLTSHCFVCQLSVESMSDEVTICQRISAQDMIPFSIGLQSVHCLASPISLLILLWLAPIALRLIENADPVLDALSPTTVLQERPTMSLQRSRLAWAEIFPHSKMTGRSQSRRKRSTPSNGDACKHRVCYSIKACYRSTWRCKINLLICPQTSCGRNIRMAWNGGDPAEETVKAYPHHGWPGAESSWTAQWQLRQNRILIKIHPSKSAFEFFSTNK